MLRLSRAPPIALGLVRGRRGQLSSGGDSLQSGWPLSGRRRGWARATSIEQRLRTDDDQEMAHGAQRPLGEQREGRLADFVRHCTATGLSSVVEIGCGAGRDGKVLAAAGMAYRGLDLSTSAVDLCRGLALTPSLGSARTCPTPPTSSTPGWPR